VVLRHVHTDSPSFLLLAFVVHHVWDFGSQWKKNLTVGLEWSLKAAVSLVKANLSKLSVL
jgi:hypothetical protein